MCRRSGEPAEVVSVEEVERPTPAENEVLVRVAAASVNPADFFFMTPIAGIARRMSKQGPVVGTDYAGTVEQVGSGVTTFKPGDEVFGGFRGAFAEYLTAPEQSAVVSKPPNVTMAQGAAVAIAGVTALQAIRDHGRLQPKQRVLINGGSGGVGTFAVQIAAAFGGEVTAVCGPNHVDMVSSIGAQHVIDYSKEDFTTTNERFDLLLDIAGSRSFAECARVLKPNGTFVLVGSSANMQSGALKILSHLAAIRVGSLRSKHKVVIFVARTRKADLLVLSEMMASGKLAPVIDRTYPLTNVREAFNDLHQGHAAGKVILDISSEP